MEFTLPERGVNICGLAQHRNRYWCDIRMQMWHVAPTADTRTETAVIIILQEPQLPEFEFNNVISCLAGDS